MCIWKELYKQPYKDEIEDPVGSGVGGVSDARLRAIQGPSLLCVIDSLSVDYHIYLYNPCSVTDLQPELLPSHSPDEGTQLEDP